MTAAESFFVVLVVERGEVVLVETARYLWLLPQVRHSTFAMLPSGFNAAMTCSRTSPHLPHFVSTSPPTSRRLTIPSAFLTIIFYSVPECFVFLFSNNR